MLDILTETAAFYFSVQLAFFLTYGWVVALWLLATWLNYARCGCKWRQGCGSCPSSLCAGSCRFI